MTLRRALRSQLFLPGAITLAVVGLLLVVTRSAGPAPHATTVAIAFETEPDASAGERLYQQDCAWCHGAEGQGTIYGPNLAGVGAASADFMLRTGRMPIADVEQQPERRVPGYTDEQIASLVDLVSSFGPGPAIPEVDPAAADLGQGAELYQIHCAACHSSTGFGGALTNGLQAPGLQDSSATEIAEAVRIGGAGFRTGHMPRFGPDVIDDRQMDSVVRYVLYLQHPEDRGGLDLAHVGPIAEGFVAWVVGLLLVVAFTRWIGKRSA
jgi:ubiquinol-cytochrome c reductase cytochrome c subunit